MAGTSYALAAASSSTIKTSLKIDDTQLDWSEVDKYVDLMKNNGKFVYLHTLPGRAEYLMKRTVLF